MVVMFLCAPIITWFRGNLVITFIFLLSVFIEQTITNEKKVNVFEVKKVLLVQFESSL